MDQAGRVLLERNGGLDGFPGGGGHRFQVRVANVQLRAQSPQHVRHAAEKHQLGRPRLDGVSQLLALLQPGFGALGLVPSPVVGALPLPCLPGTLLRDGVTEAALHSGHVLHRIVPVHLQAHLPEAPYEGVDVAFVRRVHQPGEGQLDGRIQPLGQSEIQQHRNGRVSRNRRGYQYVASVGVGVEQTSDVHLHGPRLADSL
mmetsp:Transcript_20264/g.47643  ORF Transcript_20264/g.47643 Transcript_20264/m.47643 type:complete len:201 (+) Transcript_20264:183-785(+)